MVVTSASQPMNTTVLKPPLVGSTTWLTATILWMHTVCHLLDGPIRTRPIAALTLASNNELFARRTLAQCALEWSRALHPNILLPNLPRAAFSLLDIRRTLFLLMVRARFVNVLRPDIATACPTTLLLILLAIILLSVDLPLAASAPNTSEAAEGRGAGIAAGRCR